MVTRVKFGHTQVQLHTLQLATSIPAVCVWFQNPLDYSAIHPASEHLSLSFSLSLFLSPCVFTVTNVFMALGIASILLLLLLLLLLL